MNIFVEFFPSDVYVVFDPFSLVIGVAALVLGTAVLMRRNQTIAPIAFEKELFEELPEPTSDLFATAVSITSKPPTPIQETLISSAELPASTPSSLENTLSWQQYLKDIRVPLNIQRSSTPPVNTVWDKMSGPGR